MSDIYENGFQKSREIQFIMNRKIHHRTDLGMTQRTDFIDKYVEIIINTIHMLKKVEGSMSSKTSKDKSHNI